MLPAWDQDVSVETKRIAPPRKPQCNRGDRFIGLSWSDRPIPAPSRGLDLKPRCGSRSHRENGLRLPFTARYLYPPNETPWEAKSFWQKPRRGGRACERP